LGSMNSAVAAMTLGNVKAFRGHPVTDFMVKVTEAGFVEHLNDTYPDIVVCNVTHKAGSALQVLSPWLFNTSRREYQEELQVMLVAQLKQDNDVDIDFHE
jgi:hypothetical protein